MAMIRAVNRAMSLEMMPYLQGYEPGYEPGNEHGNDALLEPNEGHNEDEQEAADQNQKGTICIVYDAARLVSKGCAANLEVLNVSAVSSGHSFVDCTTFAPELRRRAPHL